MRRLAGYRQKVGFGNTGMMSTNFLGYDMGGAVYVA